MATKSSGAGQGIERVAAILRAVAAHNSTGARLVDVEIATGLSKSTVHRLLSSLAAQGLVEQGDEGSAFFLSFDLLQLGAAAANRYGVVDVARPHLERLAERVGDTVILSIAAGTDCVVIDRAEGDFPVQINTPWLGERRPLGIGAGSLAILAAMVDAAVDETLRANREGYARFPNIDQATVRSLIPAARENGYVFNDGVFIPGMCTLGCAAVASNGKPLAALSITAIRERMEEPRRAQLIRWLREEAGALAEHLQPLYAAKLRRSSKVAGIKL
ncbi:IclR family transcriptional regulator [Rhizorhabdus wittichii]|uniref:IclR family transcriptional regulator n=1 Tax=Rhizorhabdus wittichii TaxID=160791 RepID=A0A975HC86_9SPHN|nr:IclR family transcriptional regulator [Rhizorhabdus wittichii]QTH20116.1 IclR family transcriptional regulator [Rhizorhabdus wittichii]